MARRPRIPLLLKEGLVSVRKSLSRFVAIAAIIALGSGFYAGLRMTPHIMETAADRFYEQGQLYDLRVVSTLGISGEGVRGIRALPGVGEVMPAFEEDVRVREGDGFINVRLNGIPTAYLEHGPEGTAPLDADGGPASAHLAPEAYLNRLSLIEGRMPAAADECVVSRDAQNTTGLKIGDDLEVNYPGERAREASQLKVSKFKVVGVVSSPLYPSSSAIGQNARGTGQIDRFAYVGTDAFKPEAAYTAVYVRAKGDDQNKPGSASRADAVAKLKGELERAVPKLEAARYDEIRAAAQRKVDEGRLALAEKQQQTEASLAQAARKLDLGDAQIAQGTAEADAGEAELKSARERLDAEDARLTGGEKAAQDEMTAGRSRLDAAKAELARAQAGRAQAEQAASQARAAAAAAQAEVNRLEAVRADLSRRLAELPAGDPAADALRAELSRTDAALAEAQAAASRARNMEALAATKLREIDEQIARARAALASGEQALKAASGDTEKMLRAGREEVERSREKLDEARARLDASQATLRAGRSDAAAGRSSYERAKSEAEKAIAEAKEKLDRAQKQVDDIAHVRWYVLGRDKNPGIESYRADTERLAGISQIFPLMFFLVAALVALTSMTRMVEEDRSFIGTCKALGFRRRQIAFKYLGYALAASLIGSLVGITALGLFLPVLIQHAYATVYDVGVLVGASPDWAACFIALGAGVGSALVATWAAAASTLHETPASLMLPKAPPAGHRILLERTPLWRHLSFSWKVSLRNIFRYKERLAMTVVGVAGCTGLLICGLGMADSMKGVVPLQFGQIDQYQATLVREGEPGESTKQAYDAFISDKALISDETAWAASTIRVAKPASDTRDAGAKPTAPGSAASANVPAPAPTEGPAEMVSLVVPQDPLRYKFFVNLRDKATGKPVGFEDGGVMLSSKLAERLGVKAGDEVAVNELDAVGNPKGEPKRLRVSATIENYLGSRAFMSPQTYEKAFRAAPDYDVVGLKFASGVTSAQVKERAQALGEDYEYAGNDEAVERFERILSSVDAVVVLLVVSAAVLAFIVLYNLVNINISERVREVATLRVLGFHSREVDAYIFREIMVLAALGALVGVPAGMLLQNFVVGSAEATQISFARLLHPASIALALGLTLVFAALTCLALRPKLKSIDMVESLKAGE